MGWQQPARTGAAARRSASPEKDPHEQSHAESRGGERRASVASPGGRGFAEEKTSRPTSSMYGHGSRDQEGGSGGVVGREGAKTSMSGARESSEKGVPPRGESAPGRRKDLGSMLDQLEEAGPGEG